MHWSDLNSVIVVARDEGVEIGRNLEREAVVQWLRTKGQQLGSKPPEQRVATAHLEAHLGMLADVIERGEHLKSAEEGTAN